MQPLSASVGMTRVLPACHSLARAPVSWLLAGCAPAWRLTHFGTQKPSFNSWFTIHQSHLLIFFLLGRPSKKKQVFISTPRRGADRP